MKSTRKRLVARLDKVFAEYIKVRDGGRCVICGKATGPTCGHLITRAAYATRWDESQCFCQCTGCNLTHEYRPERFTMWFINNYGMEEYEALVARSNKVRKYKNHELEEMILLYEQKTELLK